MKRSWERRRLCGLVSAGLTTAGLRTISGLKAIAETSSVGECAATQIRQCVALLPVSPVAGWTCRTAALDANTAKTRQSTAASRCAVVVVRPNLLSVVETAITTFAGGSRCRQSETGYMEIAVAG